MALKIKDVKLLDGERIDDLQLNGLGIIQNSEGFCFGVDAVFLAHYAVVKNNDRCLDLCTGTGIIPILMYGINANVKGVSFEAIEIQDKSFDMATRSVMMNGIEDSVHIIKGDIKEAATTFRAASFQVVTVNPPYMKVSKALTNPTESKMIARHEVMCNLDDVVSAASFALCDKGRFYMIHKPSRIPEIFSTMRAHNIEPKSMRLIHPYVDKEPVLVLIGGLKGGGEEMRVAPPLIIYKEQGVYTDEVSSVYYG